MTTHYKHKKYNAWAACGAAINQDHPPSLSISLVDCGECLKVVEKEVEEETEEVTDAL